MVLQYTYPSDANGNCFFHSVATNINSNPDAWSYLSILDKDASSMIDLTSKLRHLFVQEILECHRAMYEHFVQPVSDYKTEAEKFLRDGFYNSSLGDLMPVAMATALQTIIVIITTNPDSDLLYAVPIVGSPDGTICVLYHLFGTGHYDAGSYEAVNHNSTPMKPLNMKIHVHQTPLIQHIVNVTKKACHAILLCRYKELQTLLVQSLQKHLTKKKNPTSSWYASSNPPSKKSE